MNSLSPSLRRSFASPLVLRACVPFCAALVSTAVAPSARADVLAYDEHDGRSGGTVGWANDWPFARVSGELAQTAGYPRRSFKAPLGGAGATLWVAVTGRMSTVISSYSYHVPMGATSWTSAFQHPGIHFSGGGAQGLLDNNNTIKSGVAATSEQTWLARYKFGTKNAAGRYDITVSAWSGPGAGESIDVKAAPRLSVVLTDTTFDSMYAGQSTAGQTFFVDRESVATSVEEALGRRRDLYVAAHQDDDLLFMSPDLARSIQSGSFVRTVYVTDGEANTPHDMSLVSGREAGVMAAYAEMAGASNTWSCGDLGVAGKTVELCSLSDHVSLVFLRLPASVSGPDNELAALWSTPGYTVTDSYQGNTYSRSDVIQVLTDLMAGFGANHVGTLDSTLVYGGDHQEHYFASLFALEAHHAYVGEHAFHLYRGYNVADEAVNLSAGELAAKQATFQWYAACDYYMCDTSSCGEAIGCEPGGYSEFYGRQYSIAGLGGGTGPLKVLAGMCLDVAGGSSASGTAAQVASCAPVARQTWTLTSDHHIVGQSGKCLAASGGSAGSPVQIQDCAAAPEQRWTALEDGLILGLGGHCLAVSGQSTAVQLADCALVPAQLWTVPLAP